MCVFSKEESIISFRSSKYLEPLFKRNFDPKQNDWVDEGSGEQTVRGKVEEG